MKRKRYRGMAMPFVIKTHARLGESARSLLSRFARDDDGSICAHVPSAWQAISALVQSRFAALEIAAFCGIAAVSEQAEPWV